MEKGKKEKRLKNLNKAKGENPYAGIDTSEIKWNYKDMDEWDQ